MSKFAEKLDPTILKAQITRVLAEASTLSLQTDAAHAPRSVEVQHLVEIMQKNPPDVLVFASNSMRKAIMMYWILCANYDIWQWPTFAPKIDFDPAEMQTAESVHNLFEEKIHNGDGAVREPLLLGYLPNGVPFILCPTDGETSGNEHKSEATNKVHDILPYFAGVDALIFSTDTVQQIRTSPVALGKPSNNEYFKQILQETNEDVLEAARRYLIRYYTFPDDEPLFDNHLSGIYVWRGAKDYTHEIRLSVEVQAWMLALVTVCLEMGGGGVFQQLVRLLAQDTPDIYETLGSDELAAILAHVDREIWDKLVLFHIMGAPAWAVVQAIEQLYAQESSFAATVESSVG